MKPLGPMPPQEKLPAGTDKRTHTMAMVREKFARAVAKSDGCWVWKAYITHAGYGMIAVPWPLFGSKQVVAHRVSWILKHGEIPPGMFVCHHCDNRPCVRPDHLFLGTHADNMKDMAKKGRAVVPTRKLTEPQVIEIRRRRQAGEHLAPIARAFGITPQQAGAIANRKRWPNVWSPA